MAVFERHQQPGQLGGERPGQLRLLGIGHELPAGVPGVAWAMSALVKDQPWDSGPPSAEFELLVSINPPLHGIQMAESALTLGGGGATAS